MGLGSFFKKLGKGALKIAPFAAYAIPGVGPVAGSLLQAGLGAANAKVSGGGWKDALLGAGMGAAGAKLGGGLAPSKGFLGNLGNIGKAVGKGVLTNPSSLMPGEMGGMPVGAGGGNKWLGALGGVAGSIAASRSKGKSEKKGEAVPREDEEKTRRQRSPIGPTRAMPRMEQTTPNLAFPLEYGRREALGKRQKYPPYVSYLD